MCWAFEKCPDTRGSDEHNHCCCCGDAIPAKDSKGEKQWACEPLCPEAKAELEDQRYSGPVSYCCICGGMGGPDGSRCWGCQ